MLDQLRARRGQLQEYGAAYDAVIRFLEACAASAFPADPSDPSDRSDPPPDPGISEVVLHPHRPKRRAAKRNGSPSVAPTPPEAVRRPLKRGYRKMGREGKLIVLMREIIPGMPPEFSVDQLKESLLALHPGLNVAGTAVNCLDMATRGELIRKGVGRDARYTVSLLRNGKSAVEKRFAEFRSTVPVPHSE